MAIYVGGGQRRARRGRARLMADINITPMVDVMLVLLVIFMVTAPLLTAGVPLDLPKTEAAPLKGDDKPLSVSIKVDGSVWIQEMEVSSIDELAPRLRAIIGQKPDTVIFVRGDAGVNYGRIAEVLSSLSMAGFPKLSLVTQPAPQAAAAPRPSASTPRAPGQKGAK